MTATGALPDRRTVVFVVPSIRSGGMERLVSILLRGLERRAFRLHLVVLEDRDENAGFWDALPEDVSVSHLGKRSRLDALALVWRVRSELRRQTAGAAIGFMTYANLLLLLAAALSGRRIRVLATEHVTPDRMSTSLARRVQYALASLFYRRAWRVVAVSQGMRSAMLKSLRLPAEKVVVVYNPFDPHIDEMAEDGPAPHPWLADGGQTLLAVGRLVAQKAYPDLLRALAAVRRKAPARLIIVGDGPDREALQAQAEALGIADAVHFVGFQANPFRFMRLASVFVLSSEWEGFPFVLVEASRVGAPIVSTDCPFGPDEIIQPGESGVLVPPHDPQALAAAIIRVLDDVALAVRLGAAARAGSQRFAPTVAVAAYEGLIGVAGGRRA